MEVEEETKPENTEKEKEDGVESMTKDEETKGAEEDEGSDKMATEEEGGGGDAIVTREAGDSDSKAEGEKEEDGSTKGNTAKTDLEEKSEEKERGEGEESADKKEEKNGTEHDQQQQQQQQSSTSSPSIQQPTKALTAYFLFMMENRTKVNVEEGTTLQKTLSNEWQALDPEKKKVYVERAEADKKRFQREQDEFIAAGGKIDAKPPDLILSAHRVKKVLALDDEIKKGLAKETISLVSKATEHFLERFTERVASIARSEGRKTIKSNDFFSALGKYREFEFLKVPMPAPGDYRPHFSTTSTINGKKTKVVLKSTKQKVERGTKRKRNEEDSGQQDNGDDSSVRSAALPMPPPSSDAE